MGTSYRCLTKYKIRAVGNGLLASFPVAHHRDSQAASTRSQYASTIFFHAGRSVQRAR